MALNRIPRSCLYAHAQYILLFCTIWEGVYLRVWWLCTWCVYTCDSVCVKVHSLSLSPEWECWDRRTGYFWVSDSVSMAADASQRKALSYQRTLVCPNFSHSPCPSSSGNLTSLYYMVSCCVVCVGFDSFEIVVWCYIIYFCMTTRYFSCTEIFIEQANTKLELSFIDTWPVCLVNLLCVSSWVHWNWSVSSPVTYFPFYPTLS